MTLAGLILIIIGAGILIMSALAYDPLVKNGEDAHAVVFYASLGLIILGLILSQ